VRSGRCPSRAEIIAYLEVEDSRDRASRELLNHVAKCPDCRLVLKACLEVRSEAQGLLKDLESLELGNAAAARRLRAQARREVAVLTRSRGRGLGRWAAIPAAATALALVVVFFFVLSRPPGRMDSGERGSVASEIRLAGPKGEVSSRGLEFLWTHEASIGTFRLEIYDQLLDCVFQSPPLAEDHFVLPADVLGSLRPGGVYFWKVGGTLKDGRTTDSEFTAFSLKR
jgi:hypothetical protein